MSCVHTGELHIKVTVDQTELDVAVAKAEKLLRLPGSRRRVFLLGALAGVLLTLCAFGVRALADQMAQTEQRLSFVEGYLGALDHVLRGGR